LDSLPRRGSYKSAVCKTDTLADVSKSKDDADRKIIPGRKIRRTGNHITIYIIRWLRQSLHGGSFVTAVNSTDNTGWLEKNPQPEKCGSCNALRKMRLWNQVFSGQFG
jgi:hypothetical protein